MTHTRFLSSALGLAALIGAQQPGSLVERAPAHWENLVHLRDVVPVLERVLESPQLEQAWIDAADDLAVFEPSLRGLAPRFLLGPLGLVRQSIPEEIVLAFPEHTSTDVGACFHAALLGMLGWAVADGGIEDPVLEGYRQRAADLVAGVAAPAAFVAVRARSDSVAADWFDVVADTLEDAAAQSGIDCTVGDTVIDFEVDVATLLDSPGPDGQDLWDVAAAIGVLPADHAATAALREVAAGLTVTLRVARDGAVLVLELGEQERAAQGRPAPRPVWSDSPDQLLYTLWDKSGFLAHVNAMFEILLELSVEADEHLEARTSGAYFAFFSELSDLTEMSALEAFRVAVGEASVEVMTWQPLDPEVDWIPPAIRTTGIARWVPSDAALTSTTSYWTLDEWLFYVYADLAASFDDVSSRAWQRGLTRLGEWADEQSARLFEDLEELYDFLAGEGSAVFDDGVLVVAMVGADGDTAGFAVVGRPLSGEAAREFVDETARFWRAGVGADEGEDLASVDLGAGIEALVPRLPGLPGDLAGAEVARVCPHAVIAPDALILSTHISVTRALLAARSRAGDAQAGPELVTDLATDGRGLAAVLRGLAASVEGGGATARYARAALRASAPFVALLGDIRVEEVTDEGGMVGRHTIRMRD